MLDFFFPLRCVECEKEGHIVCETCVARLPYLPSAVCEVCSQPIAASGLCTRCKILPLELRAVRAPFLMDGLAREMVHRLKYNNLRALVPVMGEYMANCIKNESWQIDMTVPVPLHRKRERSRGYNQSRLLAEEVAKRLSLPAEAGGLIRVMDTPPQAKTASLAIRRKNVRDAFQAVKSFEGKGVLVVDDVCTTCSTMEACAEALLKAGASSVFGLAFARQPMKDEITVLQ